MKLVLKFGGTSLASPKDINNVAKIVASFSKDNEIVVVCSAVDGVTDDLLLISKMIEQRKKDDVIKALNKIIKKQPKNIDALQSKAFVYTYNIRDCQKAIPIVKKILKISPSDGAYCAMKFAVCGEYERAIKLAMKTLDVNQDLIAPRMRKLEWLISLTLEQKTEKDALVIINKYLKNDPKFFIYLLKYRFYTRAAQHGKAYVWDLSELRDSAGEMYSRMLKEEPETDVDAIIKSNILSEQSDHDATIKF